MPCSCPDPAIKLTSLEHEAGHLPPSSASILCLLNADATTVIPAISWVTVVRGVVDTVLILSLAGENGNATTESNSGHESVSQYLTEKCSRSGPQCLPVGYDATGLGV